MLLDTEKPFTFRCVKHNVELEPSGHSMGMGMECWPGISVERIEKKYVWHIDTSELGCERCATELQELDEKSPTYEEDYARICDECVDSWEVTQ
jgi:hypothetical protein